MFDMQRIGRIISEQRKSLNMTQMELADKMNISYQAVSSWERGSTMPDISKLPELAQLFGISIDQLLGEKSALLENIVYNKTADYLQSNTVTLEEFSQVAPILKPEQAEAVFENVRPSSRLSELGSIMPFLSRSVINELALKAAESGEYGDLAKVAPFVDRGVIGEIAKKMMSEDESITAIAPFIDGAMLNELAVSKYELKGLSGLHEFAPFVSKEVLREIAEKEFASHGLGDFQCVAPFLDREFLTGLARIAIQKDGIKAISPIAPFLDRNMLSEYVKEQFL